jgi:RNA-binding protein 25
MQGGVKGTRWGQFINQ